METQRDAKSSREIIFPGSVLLSQAERASAFIVRRHDVGAIVYAVKWAAAVRATSEPAGRQESTLLPLRGGEARWAAGLRGW